MRRNKRLKIYYILVSVTFVLLLAAGALLITLSPEESYSKEEKRVLSTFQTPNGDTLLDGSWMSSVENAAGDQFPFRAVLMKAKTEAMRLLGDRESGGVYYLNDGSLAEKFTMPEQAATKALTEEIVSFAERNDESHTFVMIVPTAIEWKRDLLPDNAPTDSQAAYLEEIRENLGTKVAFTDVRARFSGFSADTLYYRTDHHLTTEGAKEVAKELLFSLGIEGEITARGGVVNESFLGSLAEKSGFTPKKSDALTIYRIEENASADFYFTVYYPESQRLTATVYEAEKITGADPYEVFFGGNHSEIVIRTSAESDRDLLIVKDSYANAVIPFLIPFVRSITVVDPRYYSGDIDLLTEENRFSDVIFLYNANTLSTDRSLLTVLRNVQ